MVPWFRNLYGNDGSITLNSNLPEIKYAYDVDGGKQITIDGNKQYSIITVTGTEEAKVGSATDNVAITGLMLTNGKSAYGPAVRGEYAFLTVRDCVIPENTAENGSVFVGNSTASIVNSTLTGNSGSAVVAYNNTNLTLLNNTLVGNTADSGAALNVEPTTNVTAYNNLIVGNGNRLKVRRSPRTTATSCRWPRTKSSPTICRTPKRVRPGRLEPGGEDDLRCGRNGQSD